MSSFPLKEEGKTHSSWAPDSGFDPLKMEIAMSDENLAATGEESAADILKRGESIVESLQAKIDNGSALLQKWQIELNAQLSYNEKIQAGLGTPKKRGRKKATLKGKRGRKKAAAAAAPIKAAKKTKASKKVGKKTAKKATVGKKKAKTKAISARKAVARGDLPSLTNRLIEVLGKDSCSIPEAIARLEKKSWAPESKDLPTYINYMLSSNKEIFERVSRGVYKVSNKAPKAVKAKGKVSPQRTNGVTPKTRKKAEAAPETPSKAEQELSDLGATDASVPANPFEV